jgi:hypothetical protein
MKATEYLTIKTTREVKIPSEKTIELPYFFKRGHKTFGILTPTKTVEIDASKDMESISTWYYPESHFAPNHDQIDVNEFLDEYERVAQIIRDLVFKLEN